ncbi:MAG: prepilin-type N-terminal cleavage/methylation domain-containing protein [bacterium]|nr:prepilin-type N-terminal cleavage/methylation domain-containing protein [bacterium]
MKNSAGFTLIEVMLVVLIISLVSALVIPLFQDAMLKSHRSAMVADARELYSAFLRYRVDNDLFPATSSPPERALNLVSLFPLSTEGYFRSPDGLVRKLDGGQITAYDSPNIGGDDTQFWAVLTMEFDPSYVLLVAHTNDYPDDQGPWYDGLYRIDGSSIIPIAEDD